MEVLIFASLILGISITVIYWFCRPAPTIGNATNEEQNSFIETYVFPPFIERKVKEKYLHLTDHQVAEVLNGLRDFFHACQQASKIMVGMPSQVVDVAWHKFILDTREYQYFCERAFDRFLHHTPAEAMPPEEDAQKGLKRAWHLACTREGIDPKSPTRLPLLFALDTELNIPDGFAYSLDSQESDNAPYCAKQIGCIWVPNRQDPPKRLETVSTCFRKNSGGGGGCAGGCSGGCGGD